MLVLYYVNVYEPRAILIIIFGTFEKILFKIASENHIAAITIIKYICNGKIKPTTCNK